MPATEPITPRLKNDNWDLHQIAERGETPASMIKGTITREGYARVIAQQAIVHAALDHALDRAVASMPELAPLVERGRAFSPWYAEDCAAMGVDPGQTPPAPGTERFVAHIERHADAPLHILGLHYVRLGASNGNRFVARKLREVLGIGAGEPGLTSLDPFGEDQRAVWQAFKDALDALPLSEAQRDELFAGTRAAYVLTINMDLEQEMSADDLLAAHTGSLDREAFEKGHSVHVDA